MRTQADRADGITKPLIAGCLVAGLVMASECALSGGSAGPGSHGAPDQLRYLRATLADQEAEPRLRQIMRDALQRFAKRFDAINALLKARYYR